MTAILYPVAANAEQALVSPVGRAEREREAGRVAGEAVIFTTDTTGPAFATREAALEAYRAQVQENWCRLSEQVAAAPGKAIRRSAVEPTHEDGRRWPVPKTDPPDTAWRLMVSYWRIATAERPIETPQARKARRAAQPLDAETLRAIARAPMRPVEPQRPLDIGLFEVRAPEAPHILIPDE
jgi:hypothetical protein